MSRSCASRLPEAAWQWLQEGHVSDVIVLDLHMPGINGWRFCELLHTQGKPGQPVPPVLVVSATYAGIDAEDLLKGMGASAFVSLPAEPMRIRQEVRRLLEEPVTMNRFHVWMASTHDSDIERVHTVLEIEVGRFINGNIVVQGRRRRLCRHPT